MKHRPSALLALVWAGMWGLVLATPVNNAHGRNPANPPGSKLLYIMLDGFRWDYVDLQSAAVLPGFTKFLKEGVRARWTHPLFPSLSYPTWTSLVTGQYAENHGVVGNYFYDSNTKEEFSLFDVDSTGKQKWWTSEPIWTTAERAGLRTAQFLWARCDVPVNGITTQFCERFEKIPGKAIFEKNIKRALQKFDEGFQFVQVYTEHTDNTGHNFGPDSEEVLQAVRDLDDVLRMLMEELEKRGMTDHVNIVIVSDHGMTDTAPGNIRRHEIDDYLDPKLVENIADKGALMNIKIPQENVDKVYASLMKMTGVNVYKHNDIPEKYHFKNNKYVHEIVVSAEKGNFVMASHSDKQLPARSDFVYYGAHGYDPDVQDMKGIFFAKGPAFQKGKIIEPIHVVDVYQVLTHVLGLTPQPHNGTWNHVQDAFVQSTPATHDGHVHMNSSSPDHAATGVHNHTQMGDHDHTQMGAHDHGNMGAHNHDDMSAHDHPHVGTHDHDDYDYDHDEHMGDHGQMSDSGHMADHDHMSDDDHNMHKHDHSQEHSRSGSAAPSLVMATLSGILAVLLL